MKFKISLLFIIVNLGLMSNIYAETVSIANQDIIDLGNGDLLTLSDNTPNFTLTFNSTDELPDGVPSYDKVTNDEARSKIITLQTDLKQKVSFELSLTYLRRNIDDDRAQLDLLFWNSSTNIWKQINFQVADNPESFSYLTTNSYFPQNKTVSEMYVYVITSNVSNEVGSIWQSGGGILILISYIVIIVVILLILKYLFTMKNTDEMAQ